MGRLRAIVARLRLWWRARSVSRRARSVRAIDVGTYADRLGRAAEVEGIPFDHLRDSVHSLALAYPFTEVEILAVVEVHGLKRAEVVLDGMAVEAGR